MSLTIALIMQYESLVVRPAFVSQSAFFLPLSVTGYFSAFVRYLLSITTSAILTVPSQFVSP